MERGGLDRDEAKRAGASEILSSSERNALLGKLSSETELGRNKDSVSEKSELLKPEDVDRLKDIPGLRSGEWAERNLEERKESLLELENRLAEIQGRPTADVRFVRYSGENAGTFGEYRPDENRILLNVDFVRDDQEPTESINTIAHEGRHAYQSHAITHEGFHPDRDEVERWRANDGDYLSYIKVGEKRYREQPLEADAWPFGDYVAQSLTTEQHNPEDEQ